MAFQSDGMLPRKLKEATEDLCGRFLGAQHHADDDAYNAGRLLAAMMNRYNLKEVT
jgi:inhibitor of KinA sporulation pathway (predicted exonuclease)